jgi:hypothetical protein
MLNEPSKTEQEKIAKALKLLENLPPGGLADTEVWLAIRDGGLALEKSLGERLPSLKEMRLITVARRIAEWAPPEVRLLDLCADQATRETAAAWIEKVKQAEKDVAAVEQAIAERRAEVFRELRTRGDIVLTAGVAEERSLRDLERQFIKLRAAAAAVRNAFDRWREEQFARGKLRGLRVAGGDFFRGTPPKTAPASTSARPARASGGPKP